MVTIKPTKKFYRILYVPENPLRGEAEELLPKLCQKRFDDPISASQYASKRFTEAENYFLAYEFSNKY